VLAGIDAASTYCYLLAAEDHRDGDTWAVQLLDLKARGLPEAAWPAMSTYSNWVNTSTI